MTGILAPLLALVGLFFGGAGAGLWLAGRLAPGSWPAQVVSFFALPLAFAVGLQLWYGLALLGLLPALLRRLGGARAGSARPPAPAAAAALPGSWVFLPLSAGAGAIAGVVVGMISPSHPLWLVLLVYWLAGTVHGLLAWRLARRGVLHPPESI